MYQSIEAFTDEIEKLKTKYNELTPQFRGRNEIILET